MTLLNYLEIGGNALQRLLGLALAKLGVQPFIGVLAGLQIIATLFATCACMASGQYVVGRVMTAFGDRDKVILRQRVPQSRWSTAIRTMTTEIFKCKTPVIVSERGNKPKFSSTARFGKSIAAFWMRLVVAFLFAPILLLGLDRVILAPNEGAGSIAFPIAMVGIAILFVVQIAIQLAPTFTANSLLFLVFASIGYCRRYFAHLASRLAIVTERPVSLIEIFSGRRKNFLANSALLGAVWVRVKPQFVFTRNVAFACIRPPTFMTPRVPAIFGLFTARKMFDSGGKFVAAMRTTFNGVIHSLFTSGCLPRCMLADAGKVRFSGISLANKEIVPQTRISRYLAEAILL